MIKDLRALMSSSSFIDMNLIKQQTEHVHGPSCNHGNDHDYESPENDQDGPIGE